MNCRFYQRLYVVLLSIGIAHTAMAMELAPLDRQISLYNFLNTQPKNPLDEINKAIKDKEGATPPDQQAEGYSQLLELAQLVFSTPGYKDEYDSILENKSANPNTQIQEFVVKEIKDTFASKVDTIEGDIDRSFFISEIMVTPLLPVSTRVYTDITTGNPKPYVTNQQRNQLVNILIYQATKIGNPNYYNSLIEYVTKWKENFQYVLSDKLKKKIRKTAIYLINQIYINAKETFDKDFFSQVPGKLKQARNIATAVDTLNLDPIEPELLEKLDNLQQQVEAASKPKEPEAVEEPTPLEEDKKPEEPIEEIEEPIAEEPVEEIELIDPVVPAFDQFTKKLEKLAHTVESLP